jgi:phage gpG-like protein
VLELQLAIVGEYKGRRYTEDILRVGQFRQMLGDWTPAFEIIAHDVLEVHALGQFASEGGLDTGGWAKLADSTVKKRGSAHPILRSSEATLMKSFQRGGASHREEITPRRLLWGSDVPYSLFHQTGTGKGFEHDEVETGPGTGRGMARRAILRLGKAARNEIMTRLQARLNQIARQIGYRILGRGATPIEARLAGLTRMQSEMPLSEGL